MTIVAEKQGIQLKIEDALNKGVSRDMLLGMGFNKNTIRTVASLMKYGKTKRSKRDVQPLDPHLLEDVLRERIKTEHEDEHGAGRKEFVLESHLRDVLSSDLSVVEEELDLVGVEYALLGGKRIDILAREYSGRYVIIELKKSHSEDRAIGQLLYYMGKIDEVFVTAERSRGIIVAGYITDELLVACKYLENVRLIQYSTSIHLKVVKA